MQAMAARPAFLLAIVICTVLVTRGVLSGLKLIDAARRPRWHDEQLEFRWLERLELL